MQPRSATSSVKISEAEQKALAEFQQLIRSVSEDVAKVTKSIGTPGVAEAAEAISKILEPLKQFILKNEETVNLAPDRNTPLNKTIILMAHNAYNILGSGLTSFAPNQTLTIPQLLNIGLRAFELDTYVDHTGDITICHALCNSAFVDSKLGWLFGNNSKLSTALGEIARFLKDKKEFVIVKLEDYINSDSDIEKLANTITNNFDPKSIFTPKDLEALGGKWPSIEELTAMGKKVVFMPQTISQEKIAKHAGGLMFHIGFRGADDLVQYRSVHEATTTGLPEPKSGQFLSAVEDRTLPGRFLATGRQIPGVRNIIDRFYTGGGVFAKENLAELKAESELYNSGLIVGLDHLKEDDQRLTTVSGSFFSFLGNPLFCVPTVLLAAALSSTENLPTGTKLAIRTLICTCLPPDYIYLYSALDGAISEFCEESRKQISGELSKSTVRKLGNAVYKACSNLVGEIKRRDLAPLVGNLITTSVITSLAITGQQNSLAILLLDQIFGNLAIDMIAQAIAHPLDTAQHAADTTVRTASTAKAAVSKLANATKLVATIAGNAVVNAVSTKAQNKWDAWSKINWQYGKVSTQKVKDQINHDINKMLSEIKKNKDELVIKATSDKYNIAGQRYYHQFIEKYRVPLLGQVAEYEALEMNIRRLKIQIKNYLRGRSGYSKEDGKLIATKLEEAKAAIEACKYKPLNIEEAEQREKEGTEALKKDLAEELKEKIWGGRFGKYVDRRDLLIQKLVIGYEEIIKTNNSLDKCKLLAHVVDAISGKDNVERVQRLLENGNDTAIENFARKTLWLPEKETTPRLTR